MNWSGLSDPNTNLKLHFSLIGLALINLFFGVWFASVPLFAWVAARWIIMGLSYIRHKGTERAAAEWNGRYFAYDDRQVRIYWDDQALWVVAADVFKALDRQPDEKTRERIARRLGGARYCAPASIGKDCFSREGVVDYLSGLDGEAPLKLCRWFEREVFANLDRLKARDADSFRRHRGQS